MFLIHVFDARFWCVLVLTCLFGVGGYSVVGVQTSGAECPANVMFATNVLQLTVTSALVYLRVKMPDLGAVSVHKPLLTGTP
eukprot:m.266388 g.266388  ORF g.266388 m.266388 type:complete len:82 (-) comp67099_c0_seq1:1390-1635(-)